MSSTEEIPDPIIFGDESISDVTLVVGNQDFKIHKMILACRSDVFKVMFYGDFKESKEDRIEIKDVSAENFRRFLEIIYNGKISGVTDFLPYVYENNDQDHAPLSLEPKDVFKEFWAVTTEILNIADRFNMVNIIKNYFGPIAIAAIRSCRKEDCYRCFNSFIFALNNVIDVSECKKKYPTSLYWKWVDYASEEPFPDLHKKAVNILFKHLL